VLLAFIYMASLTNAECSPMDNLNCAAWVKAGFCTNPEYTKEYIQEYCPRACANSGCGTPSTTSIPSTTSTPPTHSTQICFDRKYIIGPAIGGWCPDGYGLLMFPGAAREGECYDNTKIFY
ncbi:hypothetical protein PENTCL1PPCAC_9903, partial [Pristionchus entomophagus]